MPTSNAQGGANYTATDGYWVKRWYPIVTGCIKIDAQSETSPGTWTDVSAEILKLGWTGRNINPQVAYHGVSIGPASPWLEPNLSAEVSGVALWSGIGQIAASGPTANAVMTVGCTDPSPNAVIRLSRIRDNPSNGAGGASTASNNYCGNNPSSNAWSNGANQTAKQCSGSSDVPRDCATTLGTDYWPMALFDTREGVFRDAAPSTGQLTLAGAMYYVELDVANLEKMVRRNDWNQRNVGEQHHGLFRLLLGPARGATGPESARLGGRNFDAYRRIRVRRFCESCEREWLPERRARSRRRRGIRLREWRVAKQRNHPANLRKNSRL
jgi:hypothetical protein